MKVHNIKINYYLPNGWCRIDTLKKGEYDLSRAKEMINESSDESLFANKPEFVKDCICIEITAQETKGSKPLYRRLVYKSDVSCVQIDNATLRLSTVKVTR